MVLFILVTIPLAIWALLHSNFDIRRFASSERPPQPSHSPFPLPRGSSYLFITTNNLPVAISKNLYIAQLTGYSTKASASLSMNATGLPAGINMGSCVFGTNLSKKTIDCPIQGRADKPGIYQVRVILFDSDKGRVDKWLNLTVIGATPSPTPAGRPVTCKPTCISGTVCQFGKCIPVGPNK